MATPVTRIPLDGGGFILVEEPGAVWQEGPVKAGRIGDAVRELPVTLEDALAPVTAVARAALDQLRKAGPDQIAVEFGIDLAFEAGSLQWGTPEVEPWGTGDAPRTEVVAWLERAHDRLVAHVAALADDTRLDEARQTNWGELRPTRWIVAAMITHDAYHAGEINHLRSLLGDDDRWRYIQQGFG